MKKQKTIHRFAAVAAVLLTLCLVFMMPAAAEAVANCPGSCEHVAAIGTTHYTSLQEAVDAAEDGDTIVLQTDVTYTDEKQAGYDDDTWRDGVRYTGDASFTIDLNRKTISDTGVLNDFLLYFNNKGAKANTITIKNGIISGGSKCWAAISVSSGSCKHPTTMNLGESLKVNLTAVDKGAVVQVRGAGSVLNVNSGTTVETSTAAYTVAASTKHDGSDKGGTVNIYQGAIISNSNDGGIAVSGVSFVNIYGGTITGSNGASAVKTMTSGSPVFTIYGGDITGPVTSSSDVASYPSTDKHPSKPTIIIAGGNIEGQVSTYITGDDAGKTGPSLIIIGGTITKSTNIPVKDGYSVDDTGKISLSSETPSEAKVESLVGSVVESVNYATLADAIAAAIPGSTVTVLKDVPDSDKIEIRKKLTIKNNGGFTISSDAGKIFEVYADADFKNLNLVNSASGGRCIDTRVGGITVNINNCVLTTNSAGNNQPLTISYDQKPEKGVVSTVTLSGTTINAGVAGYGIITFVPVTLNIQDKSSITGYAALYLKESGEVNVIDGSTLTGLNQYTVESRSSFGVIVIEASGVTVTLEDEATAGSAATSNSAEEAIILFNKDDITGSSVTITEGVSLTKNGDNAIFATNAKEGEITVTAGVTSNFMIDSKYLDTTNGKLACVATKTDADGVVTEYTVQAVSAETVAPETPDVGVTENTIIDDTTGETVSVTIITPTAGSETTITPTENDNEVVLKPTTESPVSIIISGVDTNNAAPGDSMSSVSIPETAEITAVFKESAENDEGVTVQLSIKIDNVTKALPVIDTKIDETVEDVIPVPVKKVLGMLTALGDTTAVNKNIKEGEAVILTFSIPDGIDLNKVKAYHVKDGQDPKEMGWEIVTIEGTAFIRVYGTEKFSSYVLVEEEPQQYTGGSATDTGSGNYQYYPRSVPTDGIVDFGTSKVVTGMELPAGSDGTVTLNIKPTFAMPENGYYAFEIDAPGYNTDAKINGGLSFQIPVADLEAAGWTAEDIVLFHGTVGEDGKITWEALPTNLVKNENGVASYKAAINGCSPFYIGFVKDGSVVNTEVVDPGTPETPETPVTPDEPEVLPPVDEPETPEQPTESPAPILAVLAGLGAAVVLRRK